MWQIESIGIIGLIGKRIVVANGGKVANVLSHFGIMRKLIYIVVIA